MGKNVHKFSSKVIFCQKVLQLLLAIASEEQELKSLPDVK